MFVTDNTSFLSVFTQHEYARGHQEEIKSFSTHLTIIKLPL
jgi:hypothetical protein